MRTKIKQKLVLCYDDGMSSTGKPRTKNRSYSNVKVNADEAALYSTAKQIYNLCDKPIAAVEVVATDELTE